MPSDLLLLGRPWPHLAARLARTLRPEDTLVVSPRRVDLVRPFGPGTLHQAFWRSASRAALRAALAQKIPRTGRRGTFFLSGPSEETPAPPPAFTFRHTAGTPFPQTEGVEGARAQMPADALAAFHALGRPGAPYLLLRADAFLAVDAGGDFHVGGAPARTAATAVLPGTLGPLQDDPTLLARLHAALPEGDLALPCPRTAHDRLALGLPEDMTAAIGRLLNGIWPPQILRARKQGPALVLYDRREGPDGTALRPRLLALVPS